MLQVQRGRDWLCKRAGWVLVVAAGATIGAYYPVRQMMLQQCDSYVITVSTMSALFIAILYAYGSLSGWIARKIWAARNMRRGITDASAPPRKLQLAVWVAIFAMMFFSMISAGMVPIWAK